MLHTRKHPIGRALAIIGTTALLTAGASAQTPERRAGRTFRSQTAADSAYSDWQHQAVDLSQVVVTGTRTPRVLADAPVQTTVIGRADIERSDATDIRDLLVQQMPGVEFSYAMNQQLHLNFAGFGGQSVLFLIDGERIAGETLDDPDFTRLTLGAVERVEIIQGAASALYGAGATGGVVNLITRQTTDPWTLRLHARGGKHGDRRGGMTFGHNQGKVHNMLDLVATATDSYDVANGPTPQTTGLVRTYYGDDVLSASDRLTWRPADALRLTARAGYFYRQQETTAADTPYRYRDYTAGASAHWQPSDDLTVEAAWSFDQYDKSRYQRVAHLDVRSYSDVQHTLRMVATQTLRRRTEGSQSLSDRITVGGDYGHEYLFNANLASADLRQHSADAFVQYDCMLDRHWEVVGALRYDHIHHDRPTLATGAIAAGPGAAPVRHADDRLTPKVNLRYRPTSEVSLRAGYGMGFRAPALKERYYAFDMAGIWDIVGADLAGISLRAEESHNLNLSADWMHGRYCLTATAACNWVRHRIVTGSPRPASTYPGDARDLGSELWMPYVNLPRYRTYGLDLTGCARWANGLSARVAYAYIYEQTPTGDDGQPEADQYMPARPHSLTLRCDWERQCTSRYGLNVSLSGRMAGRVTHREYVDYRSTDPATGRLLQRDVRYPAYQLWRLMLTQRIGQAVRVTLTVDNLLDYDPDYHYFNAPFTDGIKLMAGLSLDVDRLFGKADD